MNKKIIVVTAIILLFSFLTACAQTVDLQTTSTTNTESSVAESIQIYVDESSAVGFDYKLCYLNSSMSGDVGIAANDGSIILNPNYVSVLPVSKNRFIARKFVDSSPYTALIDETTKEIIPFFRGEICRINNTAHENTSVILSVEPFGEKRTFVNLDGQKITSLSFDGTGFTEIGMFYGYNGGEYFMFDNSGKLLCSVKEGDKAELRELNNDYTLLVKSYGNGFKYGLKKSNTDEIIPCIYDEIDVVSNDCIVARIGEAQTIASDDIVRIFNGNGHQLLKDGEFNFVTFDENSNYGIAIKITDGIGEPEKTYWVINGHGEKVSDSYDNIKKTANGEFIGTSDTTDIKISLR